MARKRPVPPVDPLPSTPFPETRSTVLAEAADRDWTRFLDGYLAPCWREIVLSCRGRGLPLDEAPDLFQELMLRLMQEGRLRSGPDREVRGNLPRRFLLHREAGLPSARFRTYLKKVIHNLICEELRRRKRQPLADETPEPWLEESISQSLDRAWMAGCLASAADQLQAESRAARTRGQQRLFAILYLATVEGRSPESIGKEWDLDRSTVAELLSRARRRFVDILAQITGIGDRDELKRQVLADSGTLIEALIRAHGPATTPEMNTKA